LNRNQQTDLYQRLSANLLPRGNKKPQRINPALQREMWRTAASLELLPIGTKTELGDALIAATAHVPCSPRLLACSCTRGASTATRTAMFLISGWRWSCTIRRFAREVSLYRPVQRTPVVTIACAKLGPFGSCAACILSLLKAATASSRRAR
jgi:hypothetical protein